MPWEKNFDIDEVLTKVMQAFWEHGFEATSMQNLVDATGVNRASLYATFGDKRELFLAALKKYDNDVRSRLLSQISSTETPLAAISAVFDRFIEQVREAGANWGCFMVNSALEMAPREPDIALVVNSAQDDIETFFHAMIRMGQESGEVSNEIDAREMSRQALITLLGLLVMIRSRPNEAYLVAVRDSFLKRLN